MLSSVLSRKIKTIQKVIVAETTAGRRNDRIAAQYRARQEPRRAAEIARLNSTTDKILQLELKKVRYIRSLSFVQGTT